jgi:two-component system response regulator PfeR
MHDPLRDAGYQVDTCSDGDSGLLAATRDEHDLLLLDLMLPQRDGISLLGMLRKTSQMPVIIVSARGAEEERITGLRQGADDYISKPFNSTELLLRVEALLRRSQAAAPATQQSICIDALVLDPTTNQTTVGHTVMDLTQIQFKILWELGLHSGDVLSKAYLSQQVLNRTLGAYDRGLDMHVSRLRRKLNDAS